MKTLALIIALTALPMLASAQAAAPSATLSWTAPSSYTDGTAISSSTPITYNVYQGLTPSGLTKVASGVTVLTQSITTGLANGTTYYWAVTAVAQGVESAQSTPVSKAFPPGTPAPVINLQVK